MTVDETNQEPPLLLQCVTLLLYCTVGLGYKVMGWIGNTTISLGTSGQ